MTSVNDDGFTARVESLEGPADADGNLDTAQATCDEGGLLDFSTAAWGDWMNLPVANDSPIVVGTLTCVVQLTDTGATFFWSAPIDAAVADPPSDFGGTLVVYGTGSARVETSILADTGGPESMRWGNYDFDTWDNGEALPDTIRDAADRGDVVGFVNFQPGTPDGEGLDALTEGELIDAQVVVHNGVFAASAPSQVCPWM